VHAVNYNRPNTASVVKFKLTPYSTLFWRVFPLHQIADVGLGVNEHMDLKLFGREIIFEEFQCI